MSNQRKSLELSGCETTEIGGIDMDTVIKLDGSHEGWIINLLVDGIEVISPAVGDLEIEQTCSNAVIIIERSNKIARTDVVVPVKRPSKPASVLDGVRTWNKFAVITINNTMPSEHIRGDKAAGFYSVRILRESDWRKIVKALKGKR